jgi:hypothetical protein
MRGAVREEETMTWLVLPADARVLQPLPMATEFLLTMANWSGFSNEEEKTMTIARPPGLASLLKEL